MKPRVLVVSTIPELTHYISFTIISYGSFDISEAYSIEDLKAQMEIGLSFNLIVFIKFEEGLSYLQKMYPSYPNKNILHIERPNYKSSLDKHVINLLLNEEYDPRFIPLHINLLIYLSQAPTDVMIKLSDERFVKIFNEGTLIKASEVKKFSDIKSSYFYVKFADYEKFQKLTSKIIDTRILTLGPLTADMISMNNKLKLITRKEYPEMDFKMLEDVAPVLLNAIKLIFDIGIEKDFEKMLNGNPFYPSHSLLLAVISYQFTKKSDQFNSVEHILMVFLCLIHDLEVPDNRIIETNLVKALHDNRIVNDAIIAKYLYHGEKVASKITHVNYLPDFVVDALCLHHEDFHGNGYPIGELKDLRIKSVLLLILHGWFDLVSSEGKSLSKEVVEDRLRLFFGKNENENLRFVLMKIQEIGETLNRKL